MKHTRYHINPKTGNPGVCSASKKCPFGADLKTGHYDSKEEARAAFEKSINDLQKNEKEIVSQREALNQKLNSAWVRVKERVGYSYKLGIPREEYESIKKEIRTLDSPLREIRAQLRQPTIKEWNGDVDQTIGLRQAQQSLVGSINKAPSLAGEEDYHFEKDAEADLWKNLQRYHSGETVSDHPSLTLEEDRLLSNLTRDDNGIMSREQLYAALIFPEKDLGPVLERLGVENVSVSPFYNSREWGLAYTVLEPSGNARSFSVYEHRNTDSLIVNGATNWNPAEEPHGPYGDGSRSKQQFFAEFSPHDKKQLAETLGFFLKEAQKGELVDDNTLANNAEHLDWTAILSEEIPAFKKWAEEKGLTKGKRGFED